MRIPSTWILLLTIYHMLLIYKLFKVFNDLEVADVISGGVSFDLVFKVTNLILRDLNQINCKYIF